MSKRQAGPAFGGTDVARSDQVFEQIASGPTLRLVVDDTDEEGMIPSWPLGRHPKKSALELERR
jgi:hypothetical protein